MEFFDLVWIDIALKRPLLGGLFFTALLSFLPRSMSAFRAKADITVDCFDVRF
jgi:hypothetical protein